MQKKFGKFFEKLTVKEKKDDVEKEYPDIGRFIEEIKIDKESLPPAPDLSFLKPTQKAETMWVLFRELSGLAWKYSKNEKTIAGGKQFEYPAKDGEEEYVGHSKLMQVGSRQEKISANKILLLKVSILNALWEDKGVRDIFIAEHSRHLKEQKEVNGEYEKYHLLKKEIFKLEDNLDKLVSELFRQRGKNADELSIILYTSTKHNLEVKRIKLAKLLASKPELAALAGYEQIADYSRQLEKNNFAWLISRRQALEVLEEKIISGRPIMILSESGAGKTTIIEAAAKKITGEHFSRSVGGAHVRAEKLFVTTNISGDENYYGYGPILEAMTGKSSEKDKKPKHKGKFYLDDEFNQRPKDVQMQIVKTVAGARPGKKFQVPGTNIQETVQPNFVFIAAGNPPTERYERKETDVAVEREFGSNVLSLDYMEQSKDNPELFILMLSALMDNGRRIRADKGELSPDFILKDGKEILNEDPKSGGFVWRFTNAWRMMFDAFEFKETALSKANPTSQKDEFHLEKLLIDAGVVVGWIKNYQKIGRTENIESFFKKELKLFFNQPTVSEEDRKLGITILKYFAIDLDASADTKTRSAQVLTSRDIGFLLPNTPRPKPEGGITTSETTNIVNKDGRHIEYYKKELAGFKPGDEIRPKDKKEGQFIFKGVTVFGQAVLEDKDGYGVAWEEKELDRMEIFSEKNISIDQAQEIMGEKKFLGPVEVEKAYGITIEQKDIPLIPFSPEELKRAVELRQMLVLRVGKNNKGEPLTMQGVRQALLDKGFDEGKKGKITESEDYVGEEWWDNDPIETRWVLVSEENIKDSAEKNYYQQTKLLAKYLITEVFAGKPLPKLYAAAITEMDQYFKDTFSQKTDEEINTIIAGNDWKKYAKELSKLKINDMLRRTPAEVLYDIFIYHENNNKKLLEKTSDWTKCRRSGGGLVYVGNADVGGVCSGGWNPGGRNGNLGVSFSRSL